MSDRLAPFRVAAPLSVQHRWDFIESSNRLHKWRNVGAAGETYASESFLSLELAADAIQRGFNPDTDYWTVTAGGRTTHFRPGRSAVNLPSGKAPPG